MTTTNAPPHRRALAADGDMDPKLTRDDWLDPELEKHPHEMRLAVIWMKTNPGIDLCGAFRFSPARFQLETGLEPDWADQALAAFSSVFLREGNVVWVRYF